MGELIQMKPEPRLVIFKMQEESFKIFERIQLKSGINSNAEIIDAALHIYESVLDSLGPSTLEKVRNSLQYLGDLMKCKDNGFRVALVNRVNRVFMMVEKDEK
jgi:hypothetical protein